MISPDSKKCDCEQCRGPKLPYRAPNWLGPAIVIIYWVGMIVLLAYLSMKK